MPEARLILLLSAVLAFLSQGAAAQSGCGTPKRNVDVVVAIRNAPPFSAFARDGQAEGFAIDIWTSVEHDLLSEGAMTASEIVLCQSIADQEAALKDGSVDVVISPLTITAERMRTYDFAQQYLQSGLTLAVASSSAIDFDEATAVIFETVAQPGVVKAVLVFLLANLALAALIRLAVRYEMKGREGEDMLAPDWVKTMIEAVVRTSGLKGLSDDFNSVLGRLLEVFMAVLGTVLSATIFGVLTSAFVGSIGSSRSVPAETLPQMRIATLEGSTAQEFLISQTTAEGISRTGAVCVTAPEADEASNCLLYPGWPEAVKALDAGDVQAVLGDWIALSYLSRLDRYRGRIEVQSGVYLNEPYGWAVRQDRQDLRAAIDRALIEDMRDPKWRKRIEAYLGAGAVAPN